MEHPAAQPSPAESVTVRFPDGLLGTMRQLATLHDRSLNAEIVHAVRQWLRVCDAELKASSS